MSKITACIDGSNISAAICDAAAWLSVSLQAPVKLLHVIERPQVPLNDNLSGAIGLGSREHLLAEMIALDEQRARLALEHGKHMLEDARQRMTQSGVETIEMKQRHGDLLDALVESEPDARVFVLGKSGEDHDLKSKSLGAHLENMVRAVHTPILVTVGAFKAPESYMIAYDGSASANEALDKFASSPLLKNLPGHIVMVGQDKPELRRLLDDAQRHLEESGREMRASLIQGNVQEALSLYRQRYEVDLMVMGAYGHSRIREFFVGSQTSKMIAASDVPLLLVR